VSTSSGAVSGGGETSGGRNLGRGKILGVVMSSIENVGGESVTSSVDNDLGGLGETSEDNEDWRVGKILGGESVRSIVVSTIDKATPSSNSLSLL